MSYLLSLLIYPINRPLLDLYVLVRSILLFLELEGFGIWWLLELRDDEFIVVILLTLERSLSEEDGFC